MARLTVNQVRKACRFEPYPVYVIVLRRYYSFDTVTKEETHKVERVEQPAWDVLVHRVFHRVIEPPLTRLVPLIDWLRKPKILTQDGSLDLPLYALLDITCYDLSVKRATVLETLEINRTTFEELENVE